MEPTIYNPVIDQRLEWYLNAKFGLFIHWGPYSVAGVEASWPIMAPDLSIAMFGTQTRITETEYQELPASFNPVDFNADAWVNIAKEAGMRYIIFTAKHHDGFCLFDSKLTDYKITGNVPGRDFIREYIDAFREQGLKVGLYYSLIDWHHKDYPNVGNHPMRNNKEWDNKQYNWDNYLSYMFKQIEELMTQYGKIDILWLDFSFGEYNSEKWKAEELVRMIKKHQPGIILNNRLIINHGVSNLKREFTGFGDFDTPEQGIPEKDLTDIYNNPIPWETCLTLNNNWGYSSTDTQWKSPEKIIHALVNSVSKNGNLLVNVGPDAQGTIPQKSVEILSEVGNWMSVNGESIYGCRKSTLPKPDWGYFTQKDNFLYAHWTNPVIGHINVKNYGDNVEKVIVLHTGKDDATARTWWGNNDKGNFFINIKRPTYLTYILPDNRNTVLKIILKESIK